MFEKSTYPSTFESLRNVVKKFQAFNFFVIPTFIVPKIQFILDAFKSIAHVISC